MVWGGKTGRALWKNFMIWRNLDMLYGFNKIQVPKNGASGLTFNPFTKCEENGWLKGRLIDSFFWQQALYSTFALMLLKKANKIEVQKQVCQWWKKGFNFHESCRGLFRHASEIGQWEHRVLCTSYITNVNNQNGKVKEEWWSWCCEMKLWDRGNVCWALWTTSLTLWCVIEGWPRRLKTQKCWRDTADVLQQPDELLALAWTSG